MNRHMPKIQRLVEKKKEQTLAKHKRLGFANEDDYGNILPPEDFEFTFPVLDSDGSFHGVNAWAVNFKALLDAHPVYNDDDDVLAGKWMFIMARMRPGYLLHKSPYPFDYSHLHPEQELYDITHGIGKDAHFAPDYRIGLKLGFGGLYEKVQDSLSRLKGDPEAEELLRAELTVIRAIQDWITRTAEITTGEKRQSNLKLTTDPPETMLEACRWMAWFSMAGRVYNRGGSGARLDDILLPYYERDTASGLIDDEDAVYYLACLLLNETRYYQIGGDGGNKLSYLILEAAHLIKSTCNLTICVNSEADGALFRRGVEILAEDKLGYPRFANGKALAEGFARNGYPLELAKQRIAAGCHWMSLEGREYTLNDVVKINLVKVFDVAYQEGNSTEEVYRRFLHHLEKALLCVAKGIDFHLDHQYLNEPELILNLICHNTIEKGRDITHGGADFYNMCCDGAGIATVADSFAALETRVEKEGRLTWRECREAVNSNFQCERGEEVRALLHTTKKFGYGGCSADTWAVRIMRDFTKIVKAKPTPGGRIMIPGLFSWADTVRFGKNVQATPNGRRAGEPISHGANPSIGFRTDGAVTAIAKAVASVNPGYGNTAPLQLELDTSFFEGKDTVDTLLALFRTHFDLGGTLINVNVLDGSQLREAVGDPEKYPDLVVRVTGFTAYFIMLSPEFRELVVNRLLDE